MTLLTLKRKIDAARRKDLDRLRKVLEKSGQTADDATLESAYAAWCGTLPNKPAWHPMSYMTDDKKLLEALLSQLEPEKESS